MSSPVSGSTSSGLSSLLNSLGGSSSSTSSSGTGSVGNVAGISSGIQWNDIIDELIAQQTAQQVTPLQTDVTNAQNKEAAWKSFSTTLGSLQTAAEALRDTAFGNFETYVGSDSANKTIFTMQATSDASPGDYAVTVQQLAQTDQVGSQTFASPSAALGLTGDFVVNGHDISVASTDTLINVRDKINLANGGTTPSGVSATILSTGSSGSRLVLAANNTGASGVQLTDGTSGVLQSLGVVDSSTVVNTTATGGAQSYRFATSAGAIATALGVTAPAATTLVVGNKTINVDLSTDTLSTIANAINAAGVTASVVSSTYNGKTVFTLQTAAPVSATVGDANSARAASLLGFTSNGRGTVTQSLAALSGLTDGTSAATASTALTALNINGASAGVAAGDTVTISGKRGDGTAVSTTLTVGSSDTVQTLLDKLNGASGFGGTGRTAMATIDGSGVIHLTDGTGGSSQLSMSMVVNQASGGTTTLGQMGVQTAGYSRSISQGADAQVDISGTVVTSSTNTITSAIPGVTLNLVGANPTEAVDLPITRDLSATSSAVQAFVTAYNNVHSFVASATASGAALAFDGALRAEGRSIVETVLNPVPGVTGAFTRLDQIGISVDKTGVLSLDSTKLQNALQSNLTDVEALFGKTVIPDSGLAMVSDSSSTKSGTFPVTVTTPATVPTVTGAGFTGTYSAGAGGDALSIIDGTSLNTATVTLVNGDTMSDILSKLNAAFQSENMALIASMTSGQLTISGTNFGAQSKLNVSYGGATNPFTQLGIAEAGVAGTDIVGTIDGVAAKGSGDQLTADSTTAASGLVVSYAGTGAFTGNIVHNLGVGALIANLSDAVTRSGDGFIDTENGILDSQISSLNDRITAAQDRISNQRASLVKQYTAMETAISQIQAQGTALTNQIKGLQPSSG